MDIMQRIHRAFSTKAHMGHDSIFLGQRELAELAAYTGPNKWFYDAKGRKVAFLDIVEVNSETYLGFGRKA